MDLEDFLQPSRLWAKRRQFLSQSISLVMILTTALTIWKTLILLSNSESPIVVVLSGSMEPAFHRGDLLFLHNYDTDYEVGDVVVFKVRGKSIPIVHRIIKLQERDDGDVDFLTKGDHNPVDDRRLYGEGQNSLRKEDVLGRAKAFVPMVGMITILMSDHPNLKYIVLAVLAIIVLTSKENN